MVTDLCGGAFNQILLKTTENDQSSNTCQSFRINVREGELEAKITKSVVLQQIFT